MPEIGERRVKVCKAIGKPVEMEYTGDYECENGESNGHPGWLCLHD